MQNGYWRDLCAAFHQVAEEDAVDAELQAQTLMRHSAVLRELGRTAEALVAKQKADLLRGHASQIRAEAAALSVRWVVPE